MSLQIVEQAKVVASLIQAEIGKPFGGPTDACWRYTAGVLVQQVPPTIHTLGAQRAWEAAHGLMRDTIASVSPKNHEGFAGAIEHNPGPFIVWGNCPNAIVGQSHAAVIVPDGAHMHIFDTRVVDGHRETNAKGVSAWFDASFVGSPVIVYQARVIR